MVDVGIAVEWRDAPVEGRVEVKNGAIIGGRVVRGSGRFDGGKGSWSLAGACRLELSIRADNLAVGGQPTLIGLRGAANPFTFFLRDVRRDFPIFIPEYGVAVTTADDGRTYEQIEAAVRARGLVSSYQRIDLEPEETYKTAAGHTRELKSPVWLGLSRDVRIFELGQRGPMLYTDYVQPRFHGYGYFWPETEKDLVPARYGFVAGRGWMCTENVRRWLDQGALPIVHVERIDDDIRYEQVGFVVQERSPLTAEGVRGTHFLVADRLSVCSVLTEKEQAEFEALRPSQLGRDEETVFCSRTVAVNRASVPRYAFFKAPFPHGWSGNPAPHGFDRASGFGLVENSDLVFGISKLNGVALGQEEVAVLLGPGESCTFEFLLPHRPVSKERAGLLAGRDVSAALAECRAFWSGKLGTAGRMDVPEKRINDMVKASYLHLDLTAYGLEPDGPLAMTDGTYSPVVSETWVNINCLESLGRHAEARRCLEYYLEKQRPDGFLQTFTGYMLENGAALHAMGEHYRYTGDAAWIQRHRVKILALGEFILASRAQSRTQGVGFGILKGQVADPVDQEQVYMLNAYAYAGLAAVACLMAAIDPAVAQRFAREAAELKSDTRKAFLESLASGPVIPLGDGTWCPTAAPWFGPAGPKCLFTDGECWWTHGSMTPRDDIIGPMHLLSREIFEAHEPAAGFLLNYQNELMFSRNVSSSQPYYSQHPLVHLRRGEVKRFLKAYYNGLAGLADREIYSWWEHYYHESPHKTHEEAEFVMQTRWMLYREDGQTLRLCGGVPRAWLEHGKRIELAGVASHYGPLSFRMVSRVDDGAIDIQVACEANRRPRRLEIRVPHPQGKKARHVDAGTYEPGRETVIVDDFAGTAKVTVLF